MKFKEWLKINERATVRNVPSSSRGTVMNQSVLRGAATTWGHADTPTWLQKGAYYGLSGIGGSVRKTLEDDIGLVVQGAGNIRPMPTADNEDVGVKYFSLPLQIPKFKHAKNHYEQYNIGLNPGDPVTSGQVYKAALRVPANMIRHSDSRMDMDTEGKFMLLRANNDNEGNRQWNWDVNESKQFTRALIYKCIVDEMNKNQEERSKYDINSFDLLDEKEHDGVMVAWFSFDRLKGKK